MLYNRIFELNTTKTDWALRLRLVRCYAHPNFNNKHDQSVPNTLECIFHDSEGDRIHATIRKERIAAFKDKLKEGDLYSVRNFVVAPNTMKYKTTTNRFKIMFNFKTTVVNFPDDDFPKAMYAFRPFYEMGIPDQVDLRQLFDVIGSIVSIHLPEPQQSNGETQKLIEVVLEDPDQRRVKCTLWGNFVDAILEGYKKYPNFMLAAVLFCKPKIYKGEVSVSSSYFASKLIINGKQRELAEYRNRYDVHGDDGFNGTPIVFTTYETEGTSSNTKDFVTIDSLFTKDLVGRFWISGDIIDIETGEHWYYLACKDCARKVIPRCGRYDCPSPGCKQNDNATIRYKVKVRIMDHSGNAAFLLWDNACFDLFGRKAADMLNDVNESDSGTPAELFNLLDMKVQCLVQVQNDGPKREDISFSVLKLKKVDVDLDHKGESSGTKNTEIVNEIPMEEVQILGKNAQQPCETETEAQATPNISDKKRGKRTATVDDGNAFGIRKRPIGGIKIKTEK
ncbi:unnamed protein product [Cuscuta epithymum]|uniref:Uncharacterized protein n=1 Tax=Cuscuta epithymum TaxID=186058 RepID=A0AAV0CZ98_9ASTE|nr:unnamed protein product [Cuscuta epithymum]